MTNLTEKWKKGELPEGWYYIKCEDGEYIDYYEAKIGWLNYNGIKKVVGRVPSYELWKAVHEQRNVLFVENTKLKELLTMVKPVLQLEYNVTENRNLIKKINQALGEE